jgi:hypothetical protein
MAYFRQLGVIGVLGACFFVAAGCGDEDDKTNPGGEAGEGGESAGKGGKSQGGSNSNAGKGGKSTAGSAGTGTAGSAGNAGTPSQGGEAGEGGSDGSAGEPPIGGGEGGGGTSTGGAGAGGASGDAGAGGNPPTLTSCANSCDIDADCAIGEDTSFFCDEATHHCVAPNAECTTNEDCVPAVSLWDPCGLDNSCPDNYVCIDWQGSGRCAPLPFVVDDDGAGGAPGTIDCFGDELRTLPLFAQQGEQEICVTVNARCGAAGVCFNGCGVAPEYACGIAGAVWDIPSGLCSCAAPAECPAIAYANAPVACE